MKLKIKNEFISTIIGTISLYFGVAFLFSIGGLSVYITSYINLKQNYVTMHYGLFINLIFIFGHTLSSPLGGLLENSLGFFKTIIVGFSIILLSNLAFIFQQNIWLCYTLTLILGIGLGISISLVGKNITLYVPNKKGLVVGILGLLVTIIGACFSFAGEKIINFEGYTLKEDEEFYPERIANKTYIYFLIGECILPFGLIFALLLIYEFKQEDINEKNSTDENKEEKLISDSSISKSNDEDLNNNQENNLITEEAKEVDNKIDLKDNSKQKQKIKQIIKTFRYWRISFILFFINFSVSFMVNTGRTFGAIIGINGKALQYVIILQTLASAMGPIMGLIVDKKGPLLILRIFSILCIFPPILLIFFMENDFVFIFSFIICILNISGIVISFSPFIMEVYGIQESVILGGIMGGLSKIGDIVSTVSAFIFSLICNNNEKDETIIDKNCLKNKYAIMYLISGICGGLSSLLLFLEKKDKYIYQDIFNEEITNNNDEDKANTIERKD